MSVDPRALRTIYLQWAALNFFKQNQRQLRKLPGFEGIVIGQPRGLGYPLVQYLVKESRLASLSRRLGFNKVYGFLKNRQTLNYPDCISLDVHEAGTYTVPVNILFINTSQSSGSTQLDNSILSNLSH
jgi:hypothetical protein